MATLLERLRAARETWVPVGHFELLLRRPTQRDVYAHVSHEDDAAFLRRVIVGWRGLKEHEVVPGGEGTDAAFDLDLCVEWLADHPEWFAQAVKAGLKQITDHVAARGDDEKK